MWQNIYKIIYNSIILIIAILFTVGLTTFAALIKSAFANPTFTVGTDPIIDISQSGTGLSLSDDGLRNVPIGFDFTFGNNTYDNVSVAMNGFLTFSTVNEFNSNVSRRRNYLVERFPSTGYNNSIKPLHSDFIRRTSGNQSPYYQTFGNTTDTNQYFVVMWDNVSEYSNGRKSTFEVILYETTNDIKFLYEEVNIDHHSANIGLQYTMTDYVEYLWYDDTNNTSLELDSFSVTTEEIVDESFEALSSDCLEGSTNILCDIYDLDTNDLTDDFLDFTGIYTGFDDDFTNIGVDEDEIIYGISFTFTEENDYFLDSIEGVDTDFSIITIDTLTTIEGELDELDLYNNDDSSVTFSSDILLVGEFDDTTIDYFTADTPDELTPILDIVEEELEFAELNLVEEIFDETEEEISDEELQVDEPVEEMNEEEITPDDNTTDDVTSNDVITIVDATNEQGVRIANRSVSSSDNNGSEQITTGDITSQSVGVSNQISAELNETNIVLQSINIMPMDIGGATNQVVNVEVTSVDTTTNISSVSTEIMSMAEAQNLQDSVIQANLESIREQGEQLEQETGEYSVDLQNNIIFFMGYNPHWASYQTQLPDNPTWYVDNYLVDNLILIDNNEALTSLVGYSSQQHSAMSNQSNIDFFRSYR